jgi:pimeloyl-ACP methyl ester carboxylesterase
MTLSAARRESRSEYVDVRGLRHHVQHWGREGAPRVIMLHGWMDVGASFQFLVDALAGDWHVIAPDWRGFGGTSWAAQGYWFADYVADLDALLERYSPGSPARLVGHSLGGNVVMLYAGIRPRRVSRVVSLEGFGVKQGDAGEAVGRFRDWLDGLRDPPRFSTYPTLDAVADRLQRNSPRLTRERALFLAAHWAEPGSDSVWRLNADPAHKLPFPSVYRFEEALAIWRCIEAPALWVVATDSYIPGWLGDGEIERRRALLADCRLVTILDAGHMMHLEQPERVAAVVEPFLAG